MAGRTRLFVLEPLNLQDDQGALSLNDGLRLLLSNPPAATVQSWRLVLLPCP